MRQTKKPTEDAALILERAKAARERARRILWPHVPANE